MPHMKGGELIADFLIAEDVPYVIGLCGHGNVGMLDPLYERRDKIRMVSVRHEQAAGHMADAYFRVRHQPVATLTSCGPGSANLVMATATAQADSSGFLAITGNVATSQFNRAPFQETYRYAQADFPSVMRPYVKRSYQCTRVDMLPLALRQGLGLVTSGRPGPVHLDVPYDVFQETADVDVPVSDRATLSSRTAASPADVDRAAELLAAAERPLIFAGQGMTISEAAPELTRLVERFAIPVVNSPNGFGTLDMTHPLALGFIGRNGAYPANQAGRRADVLLTVGARFDDRSASSWLPGYSWNIPPTKLIHVDIDSGEIGRNYPVALGIAADAKTFLAQLFDALEARGFAEGRTAPWLAAIEEWTDEWQAFVAPNFGVSSSPLRPEAVVEGLAAVLDENAILALDVGVHHNWFMQFWKPRRPQRMLNSWGFAGMGFGVCGVLGAKLAEPETPCVTVCGDGGFMMAPHILATAVENDIPAVWIVWNNFAYASIRDIQVGLYQGREIATAFHHPATGAPYSPDFAALARACGVDGITVTHTDQFADAVAAAVKSNKPVLLDVHVDADIRPTATGAWQLPPTPYGEPTFGEAYAPPVTGDLDA